MHYALSSLGLGSRALLALLQQCHQAQKPQPHHSDSILTSSMRCSPWRQGAVWRAPVRLIPSPPDADLDTLDDRTLAELAGKQALRAPLSARRKPASAA
jgi:hypothetical protein